MTRAEYRKWVAKEDVHVTLQQAAQQLATAATIIVKGRKRYQVILIINWVPFSYVVRVPA